MPDSTLALADFAAKLALRASHIGHDPRKWNSADVLAFARLAHKQYGVNDDAERDEDLHVLGCLANGFLYKLDWGNKILVPHNEYEDPLLIPRLDEPPAPEPYLAIIADLRGRLIAIRAIVSIDVHIPALDVLTADLPALEG